MAAKNDNLFITDNDFQLTVCENSIFRALFGYSKRKKNYLWEKIARARTRLPLFL
jgi:hypothetical protein